MLVLLLRPYICQYIPQSILCIYLSKKTKTIISNSRHVLFEMPH